jgi:hypothetical protein
MVAKFKMAEFSLFDISRTSEVFFNLSLNLSLSFYWLKIMEDHLYQKYQNGGQVQNGGQGNFHYLITRERVKYFSICLWI